MRYALLICTDETAMEAASPEEAAASTAEYMAIGETTMRFGNVTPRSRSGMNIGGGAASRAGTSTPQRPANQRS